MDQFLIPLMIAVVSGVVVYLLTKYGIDRLTEKKRKKRTKEEVTALLMLAQMLGKTRDLDDKEIKIKEFKKKWEFFLPEVQKDFNIVIQNISIQFGISKNLEERLENEENNEKED